MRLSLLISIVLLMLPPVYASEQVPFGDAVSDKIINYHRHTPFIATSGNFKKGAIDELARHGFKTIVDLRTAQEGVEATEKQVRDAGLNYHNLPVGRNWPSKNTFAEFSMLVEDPNNFPLLLRCGSANRVGMVWSAYRLDLDVALEAAILEGRTIGMKQAREEQLRKSWVAGEREVVK